MQDVVSSQEHMPINEFTYPASAAPLKECLHRARLKHPERSDEHQPHENGQREGEHHDRLDRGDAECKFCL